MSDEHLRQLERRWKESGLDADAEAYLAQLERVGAPELARRRVRGRWGIRSQAYTAERILDLLDAGARAFTFPMLDNGYVDPGDVRLTAFRDLSRWALIIEVVGFNRRGDAIDDCLHVFGNCLRDWPPAGSPPSRTHSPNPTDFLWPVVDGPSGPLLGDDGSVPPTTTDARVRGEVVAVSHDPAWCAERGVILARPPRVRLEELMRVLGRDHREALLATREELHARLPADLPILLTLDAWSHPDVVGDELPSTNETFQLLAEALVRGEPEAYAPSLPPNTHWSNWPEGGTL